MRRNSYFTTMNGLKILIAGPLFELFEQNYKLNRWPIIITQKQFESIVIWERHRRNKLIGWCRILKGET